MLTNPLIDQSYLRFQTYLQDFCLVSSTEPAWETYVLCERAGRQAFVDHDIQDSARLGSSVPWAKKR